MSLIFKSAIALMMASMLFSMPVPFVQGKTYYGQGKALLSWTAVPSANDYDVYRATAEKGPYQLIKTVQDGESLSFTDSGLKVSSTYYYKVEANGKMSKSIKIKIPGAFTEDPENTLMLVNKNNRLAPNYTPTNMTSMGTYALRDVEVKKEVKSAYARLYNAAEKQGYNIKVLSAYRSFELQEELFDYWTRVDGLEQALRTSAKPGTSEHQTGYALDVSCQAVAWDLVEGFGETGEGKWLAKNAHKYGFIIRYSQGTEEITGYAYEPWHIRYVGIEPAKDIYETKQTLEEYLGY